MNENSFCSYIVIKTQDAEYDMLTHVTFKTFESARCGLDTPWPKTRLKLDDFRPPFPGAKDITLEYAETFIPCC